MEGYKLSKDAIEMLPEWEAIKRELESRKMEYFKNIQNHGMQGETNQILELCGRINMIDEVLGLPEYLFVRGKS